MNYPAAYSKALKYAASETSKQLFKTIAEKSSEFGAATQPPDKTLHGAFADSLDDSGESPQLAHLVREHFTQPSRSYFGTPQLSYSTNAPGHSKLIGEDDNFQYHLSHPEDPYQGKEQANWHIDALSKFPETVGTGYHFIVPHHKAGQIPDLFPEANRYILSDDAMANTVSQLPPEIEDKEAAVQRRRRAEGTKFFTDRHLEEMNRGSNV